MSELTVLQALRLKGRVSEEGPVATLDEDPADVAATVAQLAADGLLLQAETVRVSPGGRRARELTSTPRSDASHRYLI
jgi:hypothetical protein